MTLAPSPSLGLVCRKPIYPVDRANVVIQSSDACRFACESAGESKDLELIGSADIVPGNSRLEACTQRRTGFQPSLAGLRSLSVCFPATKVAGYSQLRLRRMVSGS